MTGAPSNQLLVPPSVGVDFGVVRNGDEKLIVSSDPVTGVSERIGWYAVNVSANDVATSGNRPRFMQSIVLLPPDTTLRTIREISSQIDRTSRKLGITIAGGHTELTPSLTRPIVITTVFTFAKAFVAASGAREGDTMMLTKTAAVEGTAILSLAASEKMEERVGERLRKKAQSFFKRLSIVEEAVAAFETGYVHAMHDCTEGGVLGAAYEMSIASGRRGFVIEREWVPVAAETREICTTLQLDPLRLISSGTLLLAVEKGRESAVSDAIRKKAGSRAVAIGSFQRKGALSVLVHGDGAKEIILDAPIDELWKFYSQHQLL